MKKEEKLVNKVKRLLRKSGIPRYLHRFGPKKYELYEHMAALMIRFYCRLSYRRAVYFLNLLGIKCPSKSALQYTMKRIKSSLWQRILNATAGNNHYILAIDSTGITRTNPSYHYLKRINEALPKVPVKLSCSFDTRKKRFCSAKISVLPRHDIKDAKPLLQNTKASILVADKGYDANWLHEYCASRNVEAHIPMRQYGKSKHHNYSQRMKAAKLFRMRTYHRRELIESGFFGIKSKYGSSVSSRSARTIRAELYGRLICYNLFLYFI